MSEANLILVLNKALQKVGEEFDIYFSRIKYTSLGKVSILFTKKANAGLLISQLSNVLI